MNTYFEPGFILLEISVDIDDGGIVLLAIDVFANVVKHIFVILTRRNQVDHVISVEFLIKPTHHIVHHLIGGGVHLINVGVIEIILVLGCKAIEDRNPVGLAEVIDARQLLGLTGSDDDVHRLEIWQQEDAVSDIQVMLGVIHLDIDMLVGHLAHAIHGKQQALVEIGVEVGLFRRIGLVQLEREDEGDVDLVLESFSNQIVVQVIDARLIIAAQLVKGNRNHFTRHALAIGLGQSDGFSFLYFFQVGICRL